MTMTMPFTDKLKRFARSKTGANTIRTLAFIWGTMAVGAGLIMVFFGAQMEESPTLDAPLDLIPAFVWGVGFVGLGISIIASLRARPDFASFFIALLSVEMALLGVLSIDTFVNHAGAPIVPFLLIAIAVAILISAGGFDVNEDHQDGLP